jgi:hypothetical protein
VKYFCFVQRFAKTDASIFQRVQNSFKAISSKSFTFHVGQVQQQTNPSSPQFALAERAMAQAFEFEFVA